MRGRAEKDRRCAKEKLGRGIKPCGVASSLTKLQKRQMVGRGLGNVKKEARQLQILSVLPKSACASANIYTVLSFFMGNWAFGDVRSSLIERKIHSTHNI